MDKSTFDENIKRFIEENNQKKRFDSIGEEMVKEEYEKIIQTII